jgi:hypothetical protein
MMAALTVRMWGHEMTPPVGVRRGRWWYAQHGHSLGGVSPLEGKVV